MLTRDDLPECPICCEILEAPILILGCGHDFCADCLEEAMRFRRECPTCRVPQEARFDEIARNWNLERVIDAFIRKSEAAIPPEVKEMISKAEKVKKEVHELKEPLSEIFNQIPDLMSSIEKAETSTEKIHVRRLGMDQASIEANYKTIQDSVSALNDEKVKLNDLIVQYIKASGQSQLIMRKLQEETPRGGAVDFSDISSVTSNMSYQSSVNEGSTFAQSVGRWMKVGMRWQPKTPNTPVPKHQTS